MIDKWLIWQTILGALFIGILLGIPLGHWMSKSDQPKYKFNGNLKIPTYREIEINEAIDKVNQDPEL